jgi:hypothetical protein
MDPVASVANRKTALIVVRLLIVCTPSVMINAVGVTSVSGMFAPSGLANVTIAVTKSLVV